ncbi:olfactory receptor 5C1 [Ctenodactylus gundi]
MSWENQSHMTEFLLLGLTTDPKQQVWLFVSFLAMYLINVVGNSVIIAAIWGDAHLHTPMYFFLSNLSLVDICFSTVIVPQMLVNMLTQRKTILLSQCLTQMYFFVAFGITDSFLLAAMAFDRYVAICKPLHYTTAMSPRCCLLLVTASWVVSHLHSLTHTVLMGRLSFCGPNVIHHFFCDVQPLLTLSCSDTSVNELLAFTEGSSVIISPFIFIIVSYMYITRAVLRVPSGGGRYKVFSTCGSHLTVVALFYGTIISVYIRPSSTYSVTKDRVVTVMYTVVTPMLNPFIYSLRNKDMKQALKKLMRKMRNQSSTFDFLLLGFSKHPEQQPLLFGLFLGMYLVTLLGNLLIILAIGSDQHLHTPMYFFLANLSFIDTCFTCTIVPKVLVNIQKQDHTISHTGCLTQMYFFMTLTLLDDFLLTVMAYDRYAAICLPLYYAMIMRPRRCLLLVATSWLCSNLLAFSLTLLMAQISFCASRSIPHFFCDLPPLLKLACSDTHTFQVTMLTEAVLSGVIPLTYVLVSYAHIMCTILRIPSAGGKHKVFSTCGSHLTVVTLFYGTLFLVYFQPSSSYSADTGMMVSVIYTMVTPMLNPFIFSLRNRDMKEALWRLFSDGGPGISAMFSSGADQAANSAASTAVRQSEPGQCPQENRSQTSFTDFLLLGFSKHPEQQSLLFGLFLGMYLVTLLGNLLIILAIGSDQHLHTPMYFFLANLSFIDTCFTCTIVPKVLVNIQKQDHTISHTGCLTQMYFFMALALLDDFLLAVMAYDRYAAICLPLYYTVLMCPQRCLLLVATSWLCSNLLAFSLTLLMARISFCASRSIPHFFCDLPPLLKLACSDTHTFQVIMFAEAALSGVIPLTYILVSYAHIMHTILRIPSAGGKHKVFSTCGSHLTVVTLFYGTVFLVYFQPSSSFYRDSKAYGERVSMDPRTSGRERRSRKETEAIPSGPQETLSLPIPALEWACPFCLPTAILILKAELKLLYRKTSSSASTSRWKNGKGLEAALLLTLYSMNPENLTLARATPAEFILLGITNRWDLRVTLFLIFLPIYLVSLLGNVGMVLLIRADARLHTPMYFFLASLSLLDACYSSAIGPKMLVDLLLPRATISYAACALQMFIFAGLADAECCLLAAMAYDRYVAIGNPLLYTTVMSRGLCLALLGASGLGGAVSAFVHTTFTFRLSFCRSLKVNSFFCDIPPLLAISCDDTSLNELLLFAVCGFIQTATVSVIVVSYGFIAGAVIRMRSAEGRQRAASTCGSHLTAVAILYGTLIFMYLRPSSSYALDDDKMASVFYTLVIPALNPLIYSLRNQEVKGAFRRTWKRFFCPGQGIRDWAQEAG